MIQGIGARLKSARQARGLSYEQVEQATRIRAAYIKALEEEAFDRLPSQTHARGFLRSYAGFLNVDLSPQPQITIPAPHPEQTTPITAAITEEISPPKPAPTPPASITEIIAAEETSLPITETRRETELPPPVASDRSSSAAILAHIGSQLKNRRQSIYLSLEDVEKYTRIRSWHLESLESGNIEGLPSLVQARGLLVNYAQFLNLDSEKLLLEYADALQARRREKLNLQSSAPVPKPSLPSQVITPRIISWDLILASVLILALAGTIIFGASSVLSTQRTAPPQPTAPGLVNVLLATETPTATLPPEESVPEVTATLAVVQPVQGDEPTSVIPASASTGAPVEIIIFARQRAWVRIRADEKVVFLGRVVPGQTYTFTASQTIQLRTGNAAALDITFKQERLGLLGVQGQVVDITYTANGPLNPIPTITPFPSPTSTPSQAEEPGITPTNTPPAP